MIRLTRKQLQEIDRRAIEQYGIPGIVLMENAALSALACCRHLLAQIRGSKVLVLCGGGNNGGDGLALARHLSNHGASVLIGLTSQTERYTGDALTNYRIAAAMKLPMQPATPQLLASAKWDLIVDAIFGTGLAQPPRPPFEAIAHAVERSGAPVLAVDLPSGLDCDNGRPLGDHCIRAKCTISFVAEKAGFVSPESRQYTGIVKVGDIGCPAELIAATMSRP